ncbi:hypothetical protein H072_6232 [Dactylellina haptotyla CBS 200.50]|uniref:peptidylprolyl isomerase n=1 Tax=Dactylellina haptotyla (strain CBS 200.50) TaxID=1284197 RepID=S8AFF0_DACHA|nr:hypothetical protein H072_6232 [Dactylellina haptotyla CBS 200.50]
MTRYNVHVLRGGDTLVTLLVPFQQTLTVGELRQEIVSRVRRQNIPFPDDEPDIRLYRADGPLLFAADVLQDVVRPDDGENIYIISTVTESETASVISSSWVSRRSRRSHRADRERQSRRHRPSGVSETTGSVVSTPTTLSHELSSYHPSSPSVGSEGDSFRLPLFRAVSSPSSAFDVLETASATSSGTLRTQSSAETIRITRKPVNQKFRIRIVTPKLAREGLSSIRPSEHVFSLRSCLQDIRLKVFEAMGVSLATTADVVDIYIQDIRIETLQYDIKLGDLGVEECLVDGVLDVFVVVRPKAVEGIEVRPGLPSLRRLEQTDRGCAAFLACLRVFQATIKTSKIDGGRQDSILRAFYHITQFFPILRIVRAMMGGYALGDAEVSLLVLCFAELLKEMLNSDEGIRVARGDPNRVFEGSRLIFGYILDIATQVQYSGEDNNAIALLSSYRTVDCLDAVTRQRIHDPVKTDMGIISRNTLGERSDLSESGTVPRIVKRILHLTDADCEEYAYFPYDSVISACARSQGVDTRVTTDLAHLSTVCFSNDLSVLQPTDLAGVVQPPCITWNSDGMLAVFIGHAACALPGQDLDIWLPLTGQILTIDPSIFTQTLQPILEARNRDGTTVFEESGPPAGRKETDPSELIMFVVDCSRSMERSSEFLISNEDNQPAQQREEEPTIDSIVRSLDVSDRLDHPTAAAARRFINDHYSFIDMASIVRVYQPAAEAIVNFLILLETRRVVHLYKKREENRTTYTTLRFAGIDAQAISELLTAISTVKTLEMFRREAADVLRTAARNHARPGTLEDDWKWDPLRTNVRDTRNIPRTLEQIEYEAVPDNFLCPITHEIFEDPVEASDGFIYDRFAIRSWLENTRTSPVTGLDITSTALRSHLPTFRQSTAWVKAEDIIGRQGTGSSQGHHSRPGHPPSLIGEFGRDLMIDVTFRRGETLFTRRVLPRLSVRELYRIAFRGMRGLETEFGLLLEERQARNGRRRTHLVPDDRELRNVGIHRDCFVDIVDAQEYSDLGNTNHRSLMKIYNSHGTFKFGFWYPASDSLTMTDILMKIWRHRAEKCIGSSFTRKQRKIKNRAPNLTIWYDIRDSGDSSKRGSWMEAWSKLGDLFYLSSTGCLESEDLLSRHSPLDGQKIFKVAYYKYTDSDGARDTAPTTLTRLEVSKEIFSNFINRTIAYNYANHCGLIPFNSVIGKQITQNITYDLETFRGTMMTMRANGDTPLWDALAVAIDELNRVGANFTNAKRRVICLSDGADNSSTIAPAELLDRARMNNIVMDCFCIGQPPTDLMWVCHNTGGYKFNPRNMEEAMGVVELEPVLSLSERPDLRPATIQNPRFATATSCSRDSYPQRREHPNMNHTFTKIEYLDETGQQNRRESNNRAPRSNLHTARVLSEIRRIALNPHPYYDVYVCDENMGFWKVIMQGPSQSAYSTGAFSIYLDMDESYPLFAPKARFITPILHPNINKHGKVCHSIFDRNWTTNTTNVQLLQTIFTLLSVPETSDAINVTVALDYRWEGATFRDQVRAHIQRHAMQNRSQLRAEIDGDGAGTVVDTETEVATYVEMDAQEAWDDELYS